MAGNCRPPQCINSKEARYKVLNVFGAQGAGGTSDDCGLFDGTSTNEWNSPAVMYWQGIGTFLEIQLFDSCRIYRSGTKGWISAIAELQILYKSDINGQYTDITNTITQHITPIEHQHWELYIDGLSAGIYKFVSFGKSPYRIDSEWFLEGIGYYLINKNNLYYNISDTNYNHISKNYNPITPSSDSISELFKDNSVNLSDLTIDKTIGEETFKPIDKLLPFKIQKLE